MSVSVKKLKLAPNELSAEQIVGYVMDSQARGDYYSERDQAFMRWVTTDRVREYFGLGNRGLRRADLRDLIEGVNPITGELIRRAGGDGTRVAAVDLTVSPAPKSVSILWALADDPLRFEIEVMVAKAVARAVGRLLREQPLTRQRVRGEVQHVVAEDHVVAQAFHTTARLSSNGRGVPDPQLHIHNLLIGALSANGELRAIDSRMVMNFQAAAEAEASGALAAMFKERGFELELGPPQKRGSGQPWRPWEIRGVPASLIKAMSSRTAEIEDLKQQYMKETGREAVGTGWDAFVTSHRGPKAKLTAPELEAEWEVEAAEHGLAPAAVAALRDEANDRRHAAALIARAREERGVGRDGTVESAEAAELRRQLLEWICRDHAFVPFAEMERLAHQLAVGLLDPRDADEVVSQMLGDGDLLVTTDRQVTTLEVMRCEQRVTKAVAALLASPPGAPVPTEQVEQELARLEAEGRPLDGEQAAAVRLAVSGARFVSITGPAGTGKGYATAVMTRLWQANGRRVTALAVAGRTAQQAAADAGADEGMTVDKLRVAVAAEADRLTGALRAGALRLDSRDVLLVDEAGMLDHHRYAPLVEAAVSSGATLVQVGDDKQLSPVGPGGLWTVTHQQAMAAGKAVELREIHRAEEERERLAWEDLRAGRVELTLAWMRDQDRIRIYQTRTELLVGLVEAWWSGDRDGLMVTDTSNEERDKLNELAQARRLDAAELGAESVALGSGQHLHVGDRVLFNAIHRPAERGVKRVENGTQAIVLAVDVGRNTVELALSEPRRQPRWLVLDAGEAPLDLGYARHVVKAQGVTVNDADLAVSRHTSHNELYVMATRARKGARVHAVAAELAEGFDVTEEQIRATMGRSAGPFASEAEGAEALPAGVITVNEMNARIAAERARRERDETVRQISRRAQRSSTKEAVGSRIATSPATERSANQARRETRRAENIRECAAAEREAVLQWEGSFNDSRRRAVAQVQEATASPQPGRPAERETRPAVLPARDPMESAARERMNTFDSPRALAYYRLMGRLEEAEDPTRAAADRLVADSVAVVVVRGGEQEGRVREALAARLRDDPPGMAGSDPAARILQADAAYAARRQRRDEWLRHLDPQTPARHLAEPGAIPRAYVVADEPWASAGMVRALSVAAESHLLIPPMRRGLAQQVAAEVETTREAQRAQARGSGGRQHERARDLAFERQPDHDPTERAPSDRVAQRRAWARSSHAATRPGSGYDHGRSSGRGGAGR